MIGKQSGTGDELDMPQVEERRQRLSEEGDEPQQTCERWSKRSAFWEKWCEFAVVVSRLNRLEAEAPTGSGEEPTEEINQLRRKRAELATEIVDAAVVTVEEAIFTASLLSDGEIRVILTPQCLEDCDRALAVDGDGEQCVKTLEPDLWTACSQDALFFRIFRTETRDTEPPFSVSLIESWLSTFFMCPRTAFI